MSHAAISPTIAGIFAGASGVIIGHPFDTMKTRMQVGESITGISLSSLYRGILPPLITVGAIQSLNFTLFESFKRFFRQRSTERDSEAFYLTQVFKAGSFAGLALALFTTPVGVIKVQQQVATQTGMFRCAAGLYRNHGFKVFYRGVSCGLLMEGFGRGMYISTYEAMKLRLMSEDDRGLTISQLASVETALWVKMTAAMPAGVVGWLSVYPIDLIKSRMMLDCNREKFPTLRQCVMATWNEGGLKRMYRGLGFSLVRSGPVAVVVLTTYETTREFLDRVLAKE